MLHDVISSEDSVTVAVSKIDHLKRKTVAYSRLPACY